MGTKLLPKLRSGTDLKVGISLSVSVAGAEATTLQSDVKQILEDLGIADRVEVEEQ